VVRRAVSAIRTGARWLVLALSLAVIGFLVGSRKMVPGPFPREALERNLGELVALQHGIPPRSFALNRMSRSMKPELTQIFGSANSNGFAWIILQFRSTR